MNKKGLLLAILCMNAFMSAMNHDQQHEHKDVKMNEEDLVYEAIEAAKGDSQAVGNILYTSVMKCSASVEKEAVHNFHIAEVFEECNIINKLPIPQIVDKVQKNIDSVRENGEWQKAVSMQRALDSYLTSEKHAQMKKKEVLQAKL